MPEQLLPMGMSTLQLNTQAWPVPLDSGSHGSCCGAVNSQCRCSRDPQGARTPELGLQPEPEHLHCRFRVLQPEASHLGQPGVFNCKEDRENLAN